MRDGITAIRLYSKSSSVICLALMNLVGAKKYQLTAATCMYGKRLAEPV
jgi:hypothetical protein